MTIYLWANFVLCALSVLGGICWLVDGIKPRTPKSVAANVVFNLALLLWAGFFLMKV